MPVPARIAVIGAGMVGLSSAVNAQRVFPDAKVTVIADKFDEETTSSVAGGYLELRPDPDKPDYALRRRWSQDSWDFISQLSRSPLAGQTGVLSVYCTSLFHTPNEDRLYAFQRDNSHDFQTLSAAQIKKRGWNHEYGYSFSTYVVQGSHYLKFLMKQFQENGGQVQTRRVNHLSELSRDFDLVINCCGLGAEDLVGDNTMAAVKGQVVYVKAPWIKQLYVFDGRTFIFPHLERVAVGVSRKPDCYDLTVDPTVTEEIMERATKLLPELKGAEVIGATAGLRPHRDGDIRLELETVDCGSGRTLPVVHNYGHGSHGIALSWGTAVHAVSLARTALSRRTASKL